MVQKCDQYYCEGNPQLHKMHIRIRIYKVLALTSFLKQPLWFTHNQLSSIFVHNAHIQEYDT